MQNFRRDLLRALAITKEKKTIEIPFMKTLLGKRQVKGKVIQASLIQGTV